MPKEPEDLLRRQIHVLDEAWEEGRFTPAKHTRLVGRCLANYVIKSVEKQTALVCPEVKVPGCSKLE